MSSIRSIGAVLLCLAGATWLAAADDRLSSLTKAVTAFKLQNGVQFFVVERPYSPIVSFHLRVKAGIADEPSGLGGLASLALVNFIEGSELYGTHNPAAEKAALAEAAKLLEVARAEEAKGDQRDELKKGRADFQARAAFDQAAQLGQRPRYFESVLSQNGVTGIELRPTADFSDIAMTFPSQRAELWFRMVASWLQAPSARFFLQSREMVSDQRERAAKSSGLQRERALGSVFSLHPYHATGAGDGELNGASPSDVMAFLKAHYVSANLTIAMVGNIAAPEARRLAEFYFGKLPAAAVPQEIRSAEMLHAENSPPVRMAFPEAPIYTAAWPRPAASDKSDPVFEMLQAVLAGGPGSPMYNELIVESSVASRLSVNSRFPGGRYPGLFVFEAEPLPNRSHEDVDNAIVKVLEAVAKNGVAASDLERARLWWRNRLLGESRTAAGRAAQLVRTHTEYGTYKVEELLAKLEAVTTEDCQRVVKEYFSGKSYFSIVQLTAVNEGGQ